jgi:hypothetical protein
VDGSGRERNGIRPDPWQRGPGLIIEGGSSWQLSGPISIPIKGETYVGKTIATMTFGLSRETRDEASWFTEGGKNRPARPFYELGPSEEKAIAAVIDDAAEQQRRALGF